MSLPILAQSLAQRTFLDRFVARWQADTRVIAALLGGSHVKGNADAYSDLDVTLIASDAAYDDLVANYADVLRQLGDLVFLENFGHPQLVFFIFGDGVEGELWFGSQSQLEHIRCGPYTPLFDKAGILSGTLFTPEQPAPDQQVEILRRQINWFWHDLSHFITAMGRGQLFWAQGQLGELRHYCMNLARLKHNVAAPVEGFEKVDQALPGELLAPLQATYCALERSVMLQAGRAIVEFYQELARPLAHKHGLAYPAGLERVMLDRLNML